MFLLPAELPWGQHYEPLVKGKLVEILKPMRPLLHDQSRVGKVMEQMKPHLNVFALPAELLAQWNATSKRYCGDSYCCFEFLLRNETFLVGPPPPRYLLKPPPIRSHL